jgi:hypothetical protein
MGKLDDLISAVGKAAPESKYIRAYHGSPHSFDRFDASKIGTGEGAQAYGHGLYFSGSEDVAQKYRTDLSGPPAILIGGEPASAGRPNMSASPREQALWVLSRAAQKHSDPIQAIREAMLDVDDQFGGRQVRPIIDSLMRFKSQGVEFGPRPGKTYEVELSYPEAALLDYDATLAAQPEHVRNVLPKLNLPLEDATPPTLKMAYGFERPDNITGREIYRALVRDEMAHRGAEWSMREAAASRSLAEAGVPGMRYFDEYSRGARAGSRNYVSFPGTEDSIRILRKYGLLAPMAAGAMQDQ